MERINGMNTEVKGQMELKIEKNKNLRAGCISPVTPNGRERWNEASKEGKKERNGSHALEFHPY